MPGEKREPATLATLHARRCWTLAQRLTLSDITCNSSGRINNSDVSNVSQLRFTSNVFYQVPSRPCSAGWWLEERDAATMAIQRCKRSAASRSWNGERARTCRLGSGGCSTYTARTMHVHVLGQRRPLASQPLPCPKTTCLAHAVTPAFRRKYRLVLLARRITIKIYTRTTAKHLHDAAFHKRRVFELRQTRCLDFPMVHCPRSQRCTKIPPLFYCMSIR